MIAAMARVHRIRVALLARGWNVSSLPPWWDIIGWPLAKVDAVERWADAVERWARGTS